MTRANLIGYLGHTRGRRRGQVSGDDRSLPEALRYHRRILDTVLRSFPDGSINVFDRDLRYLYAAGDGLEPVGLTPGLLITRRLDDLFPDELVARVRPFYARAFAGETVTFILPVFGHEYTIQAWPLVEADGAINAIVAMAREIPTPPSAEVLSPRLRQVAALIAAGLTNQQIAGRLRLKTPTVRNYIEQIMERLGVASRAQIAVWAVVCGLYRPGEDEVPGRRAAPSPDHGDS